MKYFRIFFLFAIMASFNFHATAQDIKLISGDVSVLKGQSAISISFVYDGMDVGGFTEEIYLKQKKSEFKKAADGDKFVTQWKADFKEKDEKKFIEQFNMGMKKLKLTAEKGGDSKYSMVVKTIKIEPGFFTSSGGFSRETYINLTIDIIETANPDNVLATIKTEKVTGKSDNMVEMKDQQTRIALAYGASAAETAKLIVKLCK